MASEDGKQDKEQPLPFIRRNVRADYKRAEECANQLSLDALKSIGTSFAENLKTSVRLVGLPNLLLRMSNIQYHIMEEGWRALLSECRRSGGRLSDARAQLIYQAHIRRTADYVNKKEFQEEISARVEEEWLNLVNNVPEIRKATDNAVYAAIVNAWTSFEAMSLDVWESAIRIDTRLGVKVIEELQSQDKRARNSPELTALKSIGCDDPDAPSTLSRFIGFRTLPKIKRAFKMAFGCDEREFLFEEIPGEQYEIHRKYLELLEESRHVIVHRAGIVDERFKTSTSQGAVGQRLDPGDEIAPILNIAVFSGCAMLRFVDSRLGQPE